MQVAAGDPSGWPTMLPLMAGTRLHFGGESTLDVAQLPEDAARMLWGTQTEGASGAFDAHEIGYAALQVDGGTVYVNPARVAYVSARPEYRSAGF